MRGFTNLTGFCSEHVLPCATDEIKPDAFVVHSLVSVADCYPLLCYERQEPTVDLFCPVYR